MAPLDGGPAPAQGTARPATGSPHDRHGRGPRRPFDSRLLAAAWGFVLSGACVAVSFPSFFVWASRAVGADARAGSLVLLSGLAAATLGPMLLRPILAQVGEGGLWAVLGVVGLILSALAAALGPRLARLRPLA